MMPAAKLFFSAALVPCFFLSLTAPALAADPVRKAPGTAQAKTADRCAKIKPLPGTPEVPGGDIFGYTSPTDIGDPCSWSFASEHSARAGKRDGSYFALSSKTQFSYTYSNSLAFAISPFTAYTRWSDVTVAQDSLAGEGDGVIRSGYNNFAFDGLSGEIAWRILARSRGQPIAITLSAEPRWSRVDGLTGWRAEGYGTEFKLFVDAAITERLFAAMNVNYALGKQKFDIPNALWAESSSFNVSGALTAQIYAAEKKFIEGVFLGVEGRYLSSYSGLGLEQNVGNAFLLGPTFAVAFEGGRMLNLVWTPQLTGSARPASAPGALDLDNYERHEFRVKFSTPLAP
jgi:hypothetical protein